LSIQAEVGTRPPATATPHGPAGRARRGDGSKVDRCARPVRTVAGPPPGWGQPCMAQRGRSMAWGACSSPVRSAGLRGAASPVSPPAFWACNPLRTRSPGAGPTGVATWAATRRQRGPSATAAAGRGTAHANPGARGPPGPATWRGACGGQGAGPRPRVLVGPSVRLRLVVLSKPSVRAPRTRDAGAGARAARGHAP